MNVRRQFVDGRHGQVHLRRAGDVDSARPPVVCLHQSPKSSRQYATLLTHLAADRLALAPDYPGMGESDPPPAEPQVTVGDYADAVLDAVDAFTDGPVHLVGHHTGAMVAAELAVTQANRVLSVTSISAPLLTAEESRGLDEAFAPIPLDEAGTRYTVLWQRVLAHRGPGMTLEMCADSMAENLRGGEGYEWGHQAAFAYTGTYRERLPAVTQPVFVMNPRDDMWDVTPRADALLQRGQRRDYPDWGNGFLVLHAADAARDILDFIARHDPA